MDVNFKDGDYLGNDHILSAAYGFGCVGGNLSPQLSWSDAPAGAQSLVMLCSARYIFTLMMCSTLWYRASLWSMRSKARRLTQGIRRLT